MTTRRSACPATRPRLWFQLGRRQPRQQGQRRQRPLPWLAKCLKLLRSCRQFVDDRCLCNPSGVYGIIDIDLAWRTPPVSSSNVLWRAAPVSSASAWFWACGPRLHKFAQMPRATLLESGECSCSGTLSWLPSCLKKRKNEKECAVTSSLSGERHAAC